MRRFVFAVAVAVLAVSAMNVAQADDNRVDQVDSPNKQWFQNGIYIGPKSVNKPTASTVNAIKRVYFASRDFNFDAGQAGDERAGPAVAKTGVRVGDVCIVTPDRVALGTSDSAYCDIIANDNIQFWLRTEKNDNNAGDAGFRFMVISNQ